MRATTMRFTPEAAHLCSAGPRRRRAALRLLITMSRLRRIALHSRFFFVTNNLRRGIRPFADHEISLLADALTDVRRRTPFALCGYCLMPDHWHAIVFPFETASISDILMRVKIASCQRIQKLRGGTEGIWQSRFYDHVPRTRGEFDQTLRYMHLNPVRKGLVDDDLGWRWSSARWFLDGTGPVMIDNIRLPLDPWDPI
jgi:putative transposase